MSVRLKDGVAEVVKIVAACDGKMVGRTRFQKTVFLLELAELGIGFDDFEYKYYGPYSERLSYAMDRAGHFFDFKEATKPASWGGAYSVFTTEETYSGEQNDDFQKIVKCAGDVDAVVLELAATAAFLAHEGEAKPWSETKRRKQKKSEEGRLKQASDLYEQFREIVPEKLPEIPWDSPSATS